MKLYPYNFFSIIIYVSVDCPKALVSSIVMKICMMPFVRSLIKGKASLLCKVLISASVFPVFMMALINIFRMILLWGSIKISLERIENETTFKIQS